MSEIIITEDNFEDEVLNSELPVLVDFWATWCGPCQMLAPVIEEVAKEQEGVVKVGKINVDDYPKLAIEFQVGSIPTLMLFKDGEVVKKSLGYIQKEEVEAFIK